MILIWFRFLLVADNRVYFFNPTILKRGSQNLASWSNLPTSENSFSCDWVIVIFSHVINGWRMLPLMANILFLGLNSLLKKRIVSSLHWLSYCITYVLKKLKWIWSSVLVYKRWRNIRLDLWLVIDPSFPLNGALRLNASWLHHHRRTCLCWLWSPTIRLSDNFSSFRIRH